MISHRKSMSSHHHCGPQLASRDGCATCCSTPHRVRMSGAFASPMNKTAMSNMKRGFAWLACAAVAPILISIAAAQETPSVAKRVRARDLGLLVGVIPPGPLNAITDVSGVLVGQATIVRTDVRTGVTAILPHGGNLFGEK